MRPLKLVELPLRLMFTRAELDRDIYLVNEAIQKVSEEMDTLREILRMLQELCDHPQWEENGDFRDPWRLCKRCGMIED